MENQYTTPVEAQNIAQNTIKFVSGVTIAPLGTDGKIPNEYLNSSFTNSNIIDQNILKVIDSQKNKEYGIASQEVVEKIKDKTDILDPFVNKYKDSGLTNFLTENDINKTQGILGYDLFTKFLHDGSLDLTKYVTVDEATVGNYFINGDGVIVESADYSLKKFPVEKGDILKVQYVGNKNTSRPCLWDKNSHFIKFVVSPTNGTEEIDTLYTKIITIDSDGWLYVTTKTQGSADVLYKTNSVTKINGDIKKYSFLKLEDSKDIGKLKGVYNIDDFILKSDNGDTALAVNRILQDNPNGCKINFGVGNYRFDTSVIITNRCSFQGLGRSNVIRNYGITSLYTNSSTLEMFRVNGACVVNFDGLDFNNTSTTTPTGGCAIRLYGTTETNVLGAVDGATIKNCSFNGFYDNCYFDGAASFSFQNNMINGFVRYGIYVDNLHNQDIGDNNIINNSFYNKSITNRRGDTYIYQTGSRGLKIIGNKFNDDVDYAIQSNITNKTVTLIITDNSFENYKKYGIKIGNITNQFESIIISNNEFASYTVNSIADISLNNCKNIKIIGNTYSGESKYDIDLQNCTAGIIDDTTRTNVYKSTIKKITTATVANTGKVI